LDLDLRGRSDGGRVRVPWDGVIRGRGCGGCVPQNRSSFLTHSHSVSSFVSVPRTQTHTHLLCPNECALPTLSHTPSLDALRLWMIVVRCVDFRLHLPPLCQLLASHHVLTQVPNQPSFSFIPRPGHPVLPAHMRTHSQPTQHLPKRVNRRFACVADSI
jgi:hypothetical protein